jgi:hypothetical protein
MRQTITFLLMAVFTSVISAQTVNIQGDPYGGNPYTTITDALTAANDGDVILITGVHTEPISIAKSITLKGTDPTTDIIQAAASASSDGTGSRVVYLDGNNGTPITPLNITIENIGIRNGNANASSNGGGIFSDKITGLVTLKNLIIENNYSAKNGGGLSFDGSNTSIMECTIRNNTSLLDGGGIIIAPNNGAAINCNIDIKQSLLDSNTGRNGGGIWINGANASSYSVNLDIENSTISNNTATSPSSGNGGGAILSTSPNNVTLSLVHATVYNNSHAALLKAGIKFLNTSTNFSAYNSIIVSADDINIKALDFTNANTTNIVNCILGGLNAAPTLVDDVAKNNQKGRTATQAGLTTGVLTNEGGNTQVIAIEAASAAVDYCTAATGVSIPTIDQRGYTRAGTYDAGAYELDGTLSIGDFNKNSSVKIYPNPSKGFVKISGINTVNSVRVYSILGTLEKVIQDQKEFNISNLSSGIHLMFIESEGQIIVKRIIKE